MSNEENYINIVEESSIGMWPDGLDMKKNNPHNRRVCGIIDKDTPANEAKMRYLWDRVD